MSELTPCGAMFEVLKRRGGLSHREVAEVLLSNRPLSDGRSPLSRAGDRSWVSRFIVHAPAGTLQVRYFRDYGLSARRVFDQLRSGRRRLTNDQVIELALDARDHTMDRALHAQQQPVALYRNALERFAGFPGSLPGERAEALLVLFVAVGCSGNVGEAVSYATGYAQSVFGLRQKTPASAMVAGSWAKGPLAEVPRPLGLVRVEDGLVASDPYWIDPAGEGAEIGALALGTDDISAVAPDVSGHHARVWHEDGRWHVRDLGSTNGSELVSGAGGVAVRLAPGEEAEIHPGDELRLGAATTFICIEGAPAVLDR